MSLEDAVLEYETPDPLLRHLWKHSLLLLAKDGMKTELVATRRLYISAKLSTEVAVTAKKY